MQMTKKKAVALVGAGVLTLSVSGVAYAFWTSGGTGTGSAATGVTEAIEIIQTTVVEDLRPGGAPQELAGTFSSPNDGPVYVGRVVIEIDSITQLATAAGACTAADYTLVQPEFNGEQIEGDTGTWGGASIAFNNSPTVNQDGCQGATVNLAYSLDNAATS